jgi:hypothetical protein
MFSEDFKLVDCTQLSGLEMAGTMRGVARGSLRFAGEKSEPWRTRRKEDSARAAGARRFPVLVKVRQFCNKALFTTERAGHYSRGRYP